MQLTSDSGQLGETMLGWAGDLFPINRSLTGEGVRQTLAYLQNLLPGLEVRQVPTGYRAFDWTVPREWNVREAYIQAPDGRRLADFAENNLHLVGYSVPVDREMDLAELDQHLHSLPELPRAIPYRTSYYEPRWGFCLSHRQRQALEPGRYRAVIRSSLSDGVLNYGELVMPGEEPSEVLLSTYTCHPSMANNELSGPVVAAALGRWLAQTPRRHTYRLVFAPETIGPLVYLSKHLDHMKSNTQAGFVLTCLGDDGPFNLMPSRLGATLADRVAEHVLKHAAPSHTRRSFLERRSDERQWCSALVDLPVVSIMRSMYGRYPEYHTSLDDMDFISSRGLAGSFQVLRQCLELLENNHVYRAVHPGEPFLSKRKLYPTLSSAHSGLGARHLVDILAHADGNTDFLDLAERVGRPALEMVPDAALLVEQGLMTKIANPTAKV